MGDCCVHPTLVQYQSLAGHRVLWGEVCAECGVSVSEGWDPR
jgi:hypothetical protein